MKPSKEIRQAARQVLSAQGWRIFWSTALLWAVLMLLAFWVTALFNVADIQTWDTFSQARLAAERQGMTVIPPNFQARLMYTLGTLFEKFVSLTLGGMMAFGMAKLMLASVEGSQGSKVAAAFSGFGHPFGCCWLRLMSGVLILFWTLLFVIPGIIAWYRYRQAWYLKMEHPGWGAMQCLRESGRMMKGHKWQAFCLDCAYWKELLAPALLILAGETMLILGMSDPASSGALIVGGMMMIPALPLAIWAGLYLSLGHAVFYRELKTLKGDGQ